MGVVGNSGHNYGTQARALCHEFCYFDKELEVWSDEEGVEKAINGFVVGNMRGRDKDTTDKHTR